MISSITFPHTKNLFGNIQIANTHRGGGRRRNAYIEKIKKNEMNNKERESEPKSEWIKFRSPCSHYKFINLTMISVSVYHINKSTLTWHNK